MFGWIMPAPLAMPVTVTGTPSTTTRRDAPFGTVSVVMIARAAAYQPSSRAAASAAGSAATMRSTGSGSMITPVEYGSTSSGAQPTQLADGGAGLPRGVEPGLSGAGVGVAGVHHERAHRRAALVLVGEVLAADDHRRGTEAILREHACRHGAGRAA